MLTSTSAVSHAGSVSADTKPHPNLLHQLNLQANAVRRSIGTTNSSRIEPLRLVRRVIGQN